MAEEKKVYVEEEQTGSFTLRNYFRGIKTFKWWVIGSTVLGAILGFVGFKFVLNPMRGQITASYKYTLAGSSKDGESWRLLDGTNFNYYDIVSKDNLQRVKDSDPEKYKKINVDELYSNNAIAVEKIVTQYTDHSDEFVDVKFKATAKAGAFPNVEIGSDFLYAVVNLPISISTTAISNYSMNCYILDGRANETFEKQLTALSKQYSKIYSVYSEIQESFGSNANTGVDNNRAFELFDTFVDKYDTGSVTSIKLAESSWIANRFVNYKEGEEQAKIDELHLLCKSYIDALRTYERDYDIYKEALEKLSTAQNLNMSDTEYSARCLELERNTTSIKQRIENLKDQLELNGYEPSGDEWIFNIANDSTIRNLTLAKDGDPSVEGWVASNKAFKTQLESLATSLLEDRETATKAYKNVYSLYSNKVTLLDSGYATLEKTISSVLGAPIGGLVGFLISSIVTTFVFAYKVKKED